MGAMPNAFNFAASPFDCLSTDDQRLVQSSVERVHFAAGSVVLDVGAVPTHLFIVTQGCVTQTDGDEDGARAKALLRSNTDAAAARGVFGVPAFEVDGKLFWGLDGLPMLRAYLEGDAWFAGSDWDSAPRVPSGLAPRAG